MAVSIEQNHDDKGIVFPAPIAPYQVHLVGLNLADEQVAEEAERLYQELQDQGFEVLYDDRTDGSAGVKFNDVDLLGLPVRLVVSPRNLKAGVVELKQRLDESSSMVPTNDVVATLRALPDVT